MNGQPESEQLQNFHERLNQWISSQGFWFQLRYSFSRGGAKGAIAYQFLKIATRMALLLIVIAIGGSIFLLSQTGTESFQKDLETSINEKMGAESVKIGSISRQSGELEIGQLVLTGSEKTFFTNLEIWNLKCDMGIFQPLKKTWEPGLINIAKVDLELRAGADSKAAAESIAKIVLQDSDQVIVDSIQVADISINWGYSDRTYGSIAGSQMWAQRLAGSWRLRFRGGTFDQNWLKDLQIVELDVVFRRGEIVFEKALFRKGDGTINLGGLKIETGERPEVSGKMNFQNIQIASLIPTAARAYVEGSISGAFQAFGSSNSAEGIGFEGDVNINEADQIALRDGIPLLKALSVVDAFNSYHRIDFNEGSFHLKTIAGNLKMSEIRLKDADNLTLRGELEVRLPEKEEMPDLSEILSSDNSDGDQMTDEEIRDQIDLTFKGEGKDSDGGFRRPSRTTEFERLGLNTRTRRAEQTTDKIFESYLYTGDLVITLPKEAFTRAPRLAEIYPLDESLGRIPIKVPIMGTLQDITADQASEIYKKGTR